MEKNQILAMIFLIIIFSLSFISAVTVENVQTEKFFPGERGQITVTLNNNLQDDVTSVSLALNLDKTVFTTQGSSEESVDEIQEDDNENFRFTLKVPSDIKPGDYNIPYTLSYDDGTKVITKTGSFGVSIEAKTELSYSIDVTKNVIGEKDKVSFKIINSGLGDVRFVSVKVEGTGMEILSSKEEYIGTVASDDFETVNFDVIYKSENANLKAIIKYKDLENNDLTQVVELPIKVYSREEGLVNGKIVKSNTFMYIIILLIIVIVWFVYRRIKKNRKRNINNSNGR